MFRRERALPASIPPAPGERQVAFALRYIDVAVGSGGAVAPRKCVFAHYTGWLTDGKKFDSSRDTMPNGRPRNPISFPQSYRRVIAGWDLGFEGMKVGGKRRLFIPYQLGYGEAGRSPIPPKAELIFDVEVMAVEDTIAAPRAANAQAPACRPWTDVSGGR
jgi:peptidylprolyl isomerase